MTDSRFPRFPAGSEAPRTRYTLTALVAAALLVYWAANASTPLWDRDEPRFAEAAREMIDTGDLVVPHYSGNVRYDKPILGYYFFAAGMRTFGENEFGARSFSGLFGALSVVVLYLLVRRMTKSESTSLLAAAMLAFAPVMVVESKLVTVDALLLLLLLSAFTGLWRIYEGRSGAPWKALFWSALALAVLTKGPVALAAVFMPVLLMAALARDRSFLKRFGWLWGVPLFFAILAPWAIAVQVKTHGEFLAASLGRHVVGRAAESLDGHNGFPGFYVVTIFGTFFPWAFFVPAALAEALPNLRAKRLEVFLVSWAFGLLIVLELVRTKMVHYALPVFPALAILAALYCRRADAGGDRRAWRPVAAAGILALALAVLPAVGIARLHPAQWGQPHLAWRFAVAGVALAAGMALWLVRAKRRGGSQAWLGVMTAGAWVFVLVALALPAAGALSVSKPLARIVEAAKADAAEEIASGGPGLPGTGGAGSAAGRAEESAARRAPVSTESSAALGGGGPQSLRLEPSQAGAGAAVMDSASSSAARVETTEEAAAQARPVRVALYGYEEPSLVFYLGGGVEIPNGVPQTAAELDAPGSPDVLVVSSRATRLVALLDANRADRVGAVKGFNFAKGRPETVLVYLPPRLSRLAHGLPPRRPLR